MADPVAGDERADEGMNDREDSKEGDDFETGQQGVRSCSFVRCSKDDADRRSGQILYAAFCIPKP